MKLAARLETLDGARLGFLHNRKKHADLFIKELRKAICAQTTPSETRVWVKTATYGALSRRVLREIVSACDAIVVGPGDCGHGSACALRDIFELESQGIPVAWVDTEGRVPRVERVGGVFTIDYAANFWIERAVEKHGIRPALLARSFEKFGFHRALRVAGATPGSRVRVGKVEVELWPFPPPALESTTDGVLGYPYTVLERFRRTSAADLRASARRLAPQVIQSLLACGDRARPSKRSSARPRARSAKARPRVGSAQPSR